MTTLADCAADFRVGFGPNSKLVHITRYDNHGKLLPDNQWVVVHSVGCGYYNGDITNPHYLNADGSWQYKRYTIFGSAQEAVNFLYSRAQSLEAPA